MDREEAIELISSNNFDSRLRAARYFSKFATTVDIPHLQAAYIKENVSWIKHSLRRAIELAGGEIDKQEKIIIEAETEEDYITDDIYSLAIEETTGRLVHEIRPILGRITLDASKEIKNYESSKTKREIERLQKFVDTIDNLSRAAKAPIIEEFDLSLLIQDILLSVLDNNKDKIETAGPQPLITFGDKSLIELIFSNGLRNAIEASKKINRLKIVINWGKTDRDNWVSILDEGCGLPQGIHKVFDIGTTTKKGHSGMGLPLAERAIRSLRGKIILSPRNEGGTRFEFRWPINIGNIK